MTARTTIGLGVIAIGLLGWMLWWVRTSPEPQIARAETGLIKGLSVHQEAGVDHLVERHLGEPGLFTLDAQLARLGVEVFPEDRVVAVPDPSFGVGSRIEIIRATPVEIVDGGTARTVRTWQGTVGELLAEHGVTLDADDRIEPGFSTALTPDLEITITRVGVSEEIETESIAFKTVTKQDGEMEKGTTRVGQTGRDGVRTKTFEVVRENGVVTSRRQIKTEVTREPVEKVVYEGTKTIVYGSGQATWYALKSGMSAAHNTLPWGTRVKVTNLSNGKSVDVVINDHGIQGSAIIDLTADAFKLIAPLGSGRIQVRVEKDYD